MMTLLRSQLTPTYLFGTVDAKAKILFLTVQPRSQLATSTYRGVHIFGLTFAGRVYRDVVSEINSNVAAVLKKCGPAILLNEDVVRKITTIVLSVLNKEHICQKVLNDDDDFEDLDELSEMDWLLIDNGLDVVAGLAAALGPTFAELWKIFQKPILKFAAGTDAVERCGSMGAIGACTHGMGAAVTPFTSVWHDCFSIICLAFPSFDVPSHPSSFSL